MMAVGVCRVKRAGLAVRVSHDQSHAGFEVGEFTEVEVDDGLQGFASSSVAQRFGQCLEPLLILTLQGDEFGDSVVPTLQARASIARPAIADGERAGMTGAPAGLALGAGERLLAFGRPSSGHRSSLFFVT